MFVRYAILQWCLRSLLHPRCGRRTNRSSTSLVSNGYTGECHLQGILPWKLHHTHWFTDSKVIKSLEEKCVLFFLSSMDAWRWSLMIMFISWGWGLGNSVAWIKENGGRARGRCFFHFYADSVWLSFIGGLLISYRSTRHVQPWLCICPCCTMCITKLLYQ